MVGGNFGFLKRNEEKSDGWRKGRRGCRKARFKGGLEPGCSNPRNRGNGVTLRGRGGEDGDLGDATGRLSENGAFGVRKPKRTTDALVAKPQPCLPVAGSGESKKTPTDA